jgi:hypothetical protein
MRYLFYQIFLCKLSCCFFQAASTLSPILYSYMRCFRYIFLPCFVCTHDYRSENDAIDLAESKSSEKSRKQWRMWKSLNLQSTLFPRAAAKKLRYGHPRNLFPWVPTWIDYILPFSFRQPVRPWAAHTTWKCLAVNELHFLLDAKGLISFTCMNSFFAVDLREREALLHVILGWCTCNARSIYS